MNRYPKFILHLDRVRENASKVVGFCRGAGVDVAAVVKGVCADLHVARAMIEGGCTAFADSRILNLKRNP